MIFWSVFPCMEIFSFWLKFHRTLFLRVQLIINRHCFRYWFGAVQVMNHYLKYWWSRLLTHIWVSGLDAQICADCIAGKGKRLNSGTSDAFWNIVFEFIPQNNLSPNITRTRKKDKTCMTTIIAVCSTARIFRGRFSVEAGRFLSKQGVSTIIKHTPSCYNQWQNPPPLRYFLLIALAGFGYIHHRWWNSVETLSHGPLTR